MKFIIILFVITTVASEENISISDVGGNQTNAQDSGGIYDYFQPYIPAINDTLARILGPLGAEVKKDVQLDIGATLLPIYQQLNQTNVKVDGLTITLDFLDGTINKINASLSSKLDLLSSKIDGRLSAMDGRLSAMDLKMDTMINEIRGIAKTLGDVKYDLNDFKRQQYQQNEVVQQQYLVLLAMLNKTKVAQTEDEMNKKDLVSNIIVKEKSV